VFGDHLFLWFLTAGLPVSVIFHEPKHNLAYQAVATSQLAETISLLVATSVAYISSSKGSISIGKFLYQDLPASHRKEIINLDLDNALPTLWRTSIRLETLGSMLSPEAGSKGSANEG